MSPELELALLIAGIYACYLYYGVLQERLTREGFTDAETGEQVLFRATFFLLFLQCCANSLAALLVRAFTGSQLGSGGPLRGQQESRDGDDNAKRAKRRHPPLAFLACAVTYLGAMFFSNASLTFGNISYPTMSLAKSCKPVPVMVMRTFVLRQRESWARYVCVILIVAGVSSFMMFQNNKKGKTGGTSDTLGLMFLVASLALDGVTGPVQERLKLSKVYLPPDSSEMMLWQNVWAAAITLPVSLLWGDFFEGFRFMMRFPEAAWVVLMFITMSAVGQNFIFYTLLRFNSLVLSIVTTTRKFFTILTSVIRFGHKLDLSEWTSVVVVFLGLFIDVLSSKGLLEPFLLKLQGKRKAENSTVTVTPSGDTVETIGQHIKDPKSRADNGGVTRRPRGKQN